MDCASEQCCRSINFRNTLVLGNEKNCEMLHNVVYNTSKKLLEKNSSYEHVYLVNPQKVGTQKYIASRDLSITYDGLFNYISFENQK